MKKLFAFIAILLMCGYSFAQDNTATVDQFGTNKATVEQDGSSNEADVDQGAVGSAVTNFGTNLGGDWKYGAFVKQIGNSNEAVIDVNSSSNGAKIDQEGASNYASMELNASISKTTNWDRMGLDIDQLGNNNHATQKTISSFGVYGVQGMIIDQDGDYNKASQLSIGGSQTTIEIFQEGDNNNNPAMSSNTFDVSATGLQNPLALPWVHKPAGDFTQYNNAYKGVAHIDVLGDDNNTAQYQEYTVWALGGDNDAYIDITGSTNDAAQGQLGEFNVADLDVLGDGNRISMSQYGDANISTVNISGNNNIAGTQQELDGNNATINQTGNGNLGTVLQH